MTEYQIQNEINQRVAFKFKDFKDALKHKVQIKFCQAVSRENVRIWEAYKDIEEMIDKEVHMPVPYEFLGGESKRKLKQQAIEDISELLRNAMSGKLREIPINRIVKIVEHSQEY